MKNLFYFLLLFGSLINCAEKKCGNPIEKEKPKAFFLVCSEKPTEVFNSSNDEDNYELLVSRGTIILERLAAFDSHANKKKEFAEIFDEYLSLKMFFEITKRNENAITFFTNLTYNLFAKVEDYKREKNEKIPTIVEFMKGIDSIIYQIKSLGLNFK